MLYKGLIFIMLVAAFCVSFAAAATVGSTLNYQGKLTDAAGNPLTGSYSVTFKLYDVASGGTALATDTHSVTASNGLFTTTIAVTNPAVVDGRALWLGITFGSDAEMTPRQEIRPVPYALGLRPGVVGASFTTNHAGTMPSDLRPGVNISTLYDYNPGVKIKTIGNMSFGVYAYTNGGGSDGVYAYTTGTNSEGVYVITLGDYSEGVHAATSGADSDGVYVLTYGDNSEGVYADTDGDNSAGVRAYTSGYGSPAIYGSSTEDVGVYGSGREGAYFKTRAPGGGYSLPLAGVNITTYYAWNPGVRINTTAASSYGAWITTLGAYSPGVYAIGNGDHADGVQAYAFGPYGQGVLAVSEQSYAILADTNRADHKYGVYTPDYMSALRYDTNSGDVAEYMPVAENVTPGTVLVIGNTGTLESSTIAYDTRVAGIVSTEPGVSLGTKEEGNNGEELIAVAGRVPCKVDAKYGAIHPGDLLSTSDTPGHAMKAEPMEINGRTFYPSGIVLGKAMGTLESGTGTIEVLVTLQ
jgi:hypothetical protein